MRHSRLNVSLHGSASYFYATIRLGAYEELPVT